MNEVILNKKATHLNPIKFNRYFRMVYAALTDLNQEYGNFHTWYFQKVLSGIQNGYRSIYIKEHNDNLVSISILKNTDGEAKICTFRVLADFQRFGFGQEMLLKTMDILETDKPVITVSEKRVQEFSKLLQRNEFQLFHIYKNYYCQGFSEFSFNGPIEKEAIEGNFLIPHKKTTLVYS